MLVLTLPPPAVWSWMVYLPMLGFSFPQEAEGELLPAEFPPQMAGCDK